MPRYTGDLDIFIRRSPENASRLEGFLADVGLASPGLSAKDFLEPDSVIQLGREPNRIDLLTAMTGVDFEEAWAGRVHAELDGLAVSFIGREALIKNKKATGRTRDTADLEALGEE